VTLKICKIICKFANTIFETFKFENSFSFLKNQVLKYSGDNIRLKIRNKITLCDERFCKNIALHIYRGVYSVLSYKMTSNCVCVYFAYSWASGSHRSHVQPFPPSVVPTVNVDNFLRAV